MREIIAKCLLRPRLHALDALTAIYEQTADAQTIAELQRDRFNAQWARAWRKVPFYQLWRDTHDLPERIDHIRDLRDFPVLTKTELSNSRDLLELTPGTHRYTLTGGTSGISTAFPMNGHDAQSSWTNTHLGRRWNGIEPGDRLFMIWGHSHLFSGKTAWLKKCKRQAKDWAANIDRVSAYNLSAQELDQITAELVRARPAYVIAYGSCLVQLCHHLRDRGRDLRQAGVHRVVNTSETMSAIDMPLVQEVFGCTVINEYGMAEAGVVGYSKDALYPVSIFWHDFVVRTQDLRIILTTLGDRCFPLINYDTEDLTDDSLPETGALLTLNSLLGKARDVFSIRDAEGAEHNVSVVLFDHILKQIPQLRTLHYTLRDGGGVCIDYTAEGAPLETTRLQGLFADGLAHEGIRICAKDTEFRRLDVPLQTVAGKRVTMKKEQALSP